MGKISGFGLMEISRQRRRTGVLEGSTHVCEHCQGTGRVRSVESSAVAALRAIEMESVKGGAGDIIVRLPTPVGLYLLNEKRAYLAGLDRTHDLHVTIVIDDKLAQAELEIERTESREGPPREAIAPAVETDADWSPPEDLEDEEEIEEEAAEEARSPDGSEERDAKRRRRRRGGRRDEERADPDLQTSGEEAEDEEGEETEEDVAEAMRPGGEEDGGPRRRRRRRGRRGGRRLREDGRVTDVYAWITPPGVAGDGADGASDPYAWSDPHAASEGAASRPGVDFASPPRAPDAVGAGASGGERKRSRNRRRGRGGAEGPAPRRPAEAVDADLYAWNYEGDAAEGESPKETPAAFELRPSLPGETLEVTSRLASPDGAGAPNEAVPLEASHEPPAAETSADEAPAAEAPAPKRRRSRAKAAQAPAPAEPAVSPEAASDAQAPEAQAPQAQASETDLLAAAPAPTAAPAPVGAAPEPSPEPDPAEILAPPATPRRGWWRRLV
jgi:ribonuclease E